MIHRRLGVYTLAVLALLAGLLLFRTDLQGKAVTSPAEAPQDSVAAAALEAEAETEEPAREAPLALPDSIVESVLRNPRGIEPIPPTFIDMETLWLARVIYSETKRPEEQELVAWVVRNRVETAYRGKRTYEDVVLDPYQFSAFNPRSRKHRYYSNLGVHSKARGWAKTLALAYYVRHAASSLRPFSGKTRHFYSERSLPSDTTHPDWSEGLEPVTPQRPVKLDAQRFRFYAGVM